MKNFIKLFILLLSLTIVSCSKDDEPQPDKPEILGKWFLKMVNAKMVFGTDAVNVDFSEWTAEDFLEFKADNKVVSSSSLDENAMGTYEGTYSLTETNGVKKLLLKEPGTNESLAVDVKKLTADSLVFSFSYEAEVEQGTTVNMNATYRYARK